MRLLFTLLVLVGLASPMAAQERLKVVTTISDLASLTRSIGGDVVEIDSFVRPGDDPHAVLAKPSMLLKLSRADAVIVMGMNYEHAFMPALLQKVRNQRVMPGSPGYLELGSSIQPLEVPAKLDRGQGADLHPLGNPHFNLNPEYGRVMAAAIRDHLKASAPDRADEIQKNWQACDDAKRRLESWRKLLEPLQGAPVLTYHNSWPYFAQAFGLDIVGIVEPKPGLPPTARHLGSLAAVARQRGVKLLLIEPWFDERRVAALQSVDGLQVKQAAPTCGFERGGAEYLDHQEYLVNLVADAHGLERD